MTLSSGGIRFVDGYLTETGRPVRLRIENDIVADVAPAASAPDRWIAPGLIDIQVNGFGGYDFNATDADAESVSAVIRVLWRHGTTGACPTVGTQAESHMERCFRAIASAARGDELVSHSILGIHVEGPYISPEDGPRGAHAKRYLRPPDVAEYHRWQEAADGLIRIITLAPELEGAAEYIRAIVADGVVAAVGHTAATEAQIDAAVNSGARLSTHLGNGAHALIPRHSNYIWPQLADDRLVAGLILDGEHLPPSVIKAFIRAKGTGRVVMVSDSAWIAGLPPGDYSGLAGPVELLPSGRLVLKGTPYLAGATVPLSVGVGNSISWGDLSVRQAFELASSNPARVLGLDRPPRERGSVRVGASADLVIFTFDETARQIHVQETIIAGTTVHTSGNRSPLGMS